jgi:hypothetical protein
VLVHHLLLGGSVALLLGGGVRAASRLTDDALTRAVAAATLAASVATLEALALGVVGLGTTPWVLFGGAVVAWLLAWGLVPGAGVSFGQQLGGWLESWSPLGRIAAGAAVGVWLAWTVWLLRFPAFDWDGLAYHIPEVVTWVRNGSPGSVVTVFPGYPYGSFPVTNEVLLSWGSGLGRSFVWITIWPGLLFALLAASGWLGLRSLGVPRVAAALATASLCAAPMATSYQLNGPNSDFPALVWLVAAAALCAACWRDERPGLFLAALLAAALAVGTKTTSAALAGLVVAITAFHLRGSLRAVGAPLALAVAGALVVGGTWYLRNLFEHGSPLWPFFAAPWGDPIPHLLGHPEQFTFFQRPLATLARFGDTGYVKDTFLGALVAFGGALIAPVFVRRRAVVAGAAASALSVFLWTLAEDTGAPSRTSDFAGALYGSPRLLMPGVAVATLTLALAARDAGRRATSAWTALLAVVVAINVWQLFDLGFPKAPTVWTPLAGALVLGAVAFATGRLPWRQIVRPAGFAGCALALGAALAVTATHLVERHERVGLDPRANYFDANLIALLVDGQWSDRRTIYAAPVMTAMLAGNDLSRRVEPIPRRETCQAIEARARRGWVIVEYLNTDLMYGPSTTRACVSTWHPAYQNTILAVYNARSVPQHP